MAINDPQIKKDTRRDAWDRDYLPYHHQNSKSKTKVDMNITPVYVFAMFFIAILVMVSNTND